MGRTIVLGTVTNRQTASFASAYNKKYYWKVFVSDGILNISYFYGFTTKNAIPTLGSPSPANGSTGNALSPKTNITANTGGDDQSLTITWWYNTSGAPTTWTNYGHNNSVGNGTYRQTFSAANSYNKKYYWKVTVSDGIVNISYFYRFTTKNTIPTLSSPSPANGSTGKALSPKTNITANTGGDGHSLTITWWYNTSGAPTTWTKYGQNSSAGNNTYRQTASFASAYNKKYYWKVCVSDGIANVSYFYGFTTLNTVPVLSTPSPSNATTGQPVNVQTSIVANTGGDAQSLTITWFNNKTGPTTWVNYGHNTSVGNGTYRQSESWASSYGTTYYWKVTVSDGITNVSYWYSFTTVAIGVPSNSNPTPSDGATGQTLNPPLGITVSNSNGINMTVIMRTNATGSWATIGTNSSVTNNTVVRQTPMTMTSYNHTYWWSVNTSLGSIWRNTTFGLTTLVNTAPTFGPPSPLNGSTNQPLNLIWSIPITDPEGDLVSWTIQCTNGQSTSGTNASNGTQSLTLSGLPYSTTYTMWVNATDPTGSATFTRGWYTITTQNLLVNSPPTLTDPSPANGSTTVSVSTPVVSITIQDPEGDLFNWSITTSPDIGSSSGTASNGTVTCAITNLDYSTTYTWTVHVSDGCSWTNTSYHFSTENQGKGGGGSSQGGDLPGNSINSTINWPPATPMQPSGSALVETGANSIYSSVATDPDGDQLRYRFDWGDGTFSEWSPMVASNVSVSMGHAWTSDGTYQIQVIAQDEHGLNSSWSPILEVVVAGVNATGNLSGIQIEVAQNTAADQTILFNASGSYGLDGANASYVWDFGDGSYGTGMNPSHVYANPGTYTVSLTVTDSNGHTQTKTMTVTVAASSKTTEEKDRNLLLFNFIWVLIGGMIVLSLCLIVVLRSRLTPLFHRRTHLGHNKRER